MKFFPALKTILFLYFFSMILFAESLHAESNDKPKLKYILTYVKNNKSFLNVSVEFKSGLEKNTIIVLPSTFAGNTELFKNITDIHVTAARIEKTKVSNELKLIHAPNQLITINYKVMQKWNGPLNNFKNFLAPIFQKDYFQFIGNSVLLYPKSYSKQDKIILLLDWDVPKHWKIMNSYVQTNKNQRIITNLDNVLNSLYLSGDYRIYNNPVRDGVITSAIRGRWSFDEKEFSKNVANIISNNRKFWNDNSSSNFLVSLIPVETYKQEMSGTGLYNAFAIALPLNYIPDYTLWYVITHESLHTWINPDIFNITEETAYLYYWFSEGFTDYYANLLNLRERLITLPDYVKKYNKTLVDYYSSTANSYTIEQVKIKFWKDTYTQRLPYQQGAILANNWNAQIKQASKNQMSLDDLMRSLILFEKNGTKLTPKNMEKIAKHYKKENLSKEIHDIYSGHLISPNAGSLGPCVHMVEKMLAPYSVGFDMKSSKLKHSITSIQLKSRAYDAGLRNGQEVINIETQPDDISQMIEVTVKTNNKVKVIKYYPYKGELKLIPQFVLNKTMWEKDPDKCLFWFKK